MCFDGRNKVMFDRRGFMCDTDIGAWHPRRNALKLLRLVYISLFFLFVMPAVQPDHELQYLWNLRQFIARVARLHLMRHFELECFKRPRDRLYLIYDAFDCWRELNFEGRRQRWSQHLRFLGCHNLDVFASLQHRDGSYASVPESWWSYETQKTFDASNPIASTYLSGLYCRGP